jgi:hypothetical protein
MGEWKKIGKTVTDSNAQAIRQSGRGSKANKK